ncbi:unnamed protein product [Acanthoscelides obtectus]|uniref:palmitoyl-protein hydrolase n=2 Tax=Acanthoscelides obtectus TaxID=200917 RepID=A0A9P0M0A4_ACAOB|nr:unnamed protein product [Acanthoscelides obtectus]CAK1634122.1 Lysophospholipase-like protein 1 [Acanthoscelides obtectus]
MAMEALHLVKQTGKACTGSVIFLHGSGDTGQGFLNWVKFLMGSDFGLPHINFYFPTAPLRPYTPLGGSTSNVWFDRYNITPDVPEHIQTLEAIGQEMKGLIGKVADSGVPLNRIVIGGFSMGGALALHTAYRFSPGLAGAFALSSFLNNNSVLYSNVKTRDTPLYMCHGDRDTLVPISWGQNTFQDLTKLGIKGEFTPIKNTLHEIKQKEIEDLFRWIEKVLPPVENK